MPNHCTNRLIVTGNSERVNRLKLAVSGGEKQPFSFERILPIPFELHCHPSPNKHKKRFQAKYGAKSWYDWAIENWDTKWDAYSFVPWNTEPNKIPSKWAGEVIDRIGFDTAWGAPKSVITKLAEYFPELRIELQYAETGMCFAGRLVFENGKVVESEEVTADTDNEAYESMCQDLGIWCDEWDEKEAEVSEKTP